MRVGIIQYPGSNCDLDTKRYFPNSFFIWHKEEVFPSKMDLLVLPGGFAFGDRIYNKATEEYSIDPGTMAINSPVSKIIFEAHKKKVPILGICNGFQILIKLKLLPGNLIINDNKKFTCKKVNCQVNSNFLNKKDNLFSLYIANSYGKYIPENFKDKALFEDQIFLKYKEDIFEVGSHERIAGICNQERNIFGMMPHPERNNDNFKEILDNILILSQYFPFSLSYQNIPSNNYINNKINTLMNSEHISYKSTKKYLKTLHTKEDWVIQGPGENAGIINLSSDYCLAVRIESHNHPTFINPFEGAATGVGGILRDIFTMGARPIGILDFLRFGNDKNSEELLTKAVEGISYYGNCFGVANIGGDCYLGDCFNKNPIINIACLGIIKKENIIYGEVQDENQVLIYIGNKTGKEGVDGAAMASDSFSENQDLDKIKDKIQKSDPYLEKLLLEACIEISEKKLARGMQDLGAGGLLCATMEVVKRGREKYKKNMGCNIFLDNIPLKDNITIDAYSILASETQERMLLVADKKNIREIKEIFLKWDLESSIIGVINNSNHYNVFEKNKLIYKKDFIEEREIEENWNLNKLKNLSDIKKLENLQLWNRYDSTIGNRTIKGPDQSGSYSIINIFEINKKLILTWGSDLESIYKKMIDLNGQALSLVNCLNYGHPKDSIGDLVEYLQELNKKCKEYKVPIIGGNVSLYNSTDDKSINPTPILLLIGILKE